MNMMSMVKITAKEVIAQDIREQINLEIRPLLPDSLHGDWDRALYWEPRVPSLLGSIEKEAKLVSMGQKLSMWHDIRSTRDHEAISQYDNLSTIGPVLRDDSYVTVLQGNEWVVNLIEFALSVSHTKEYWRAWHVIIGVALGYPFASIIQFSDRSVADQPFEEVEPFHKR